jgi:hypothetical protein
MESTPEAATSEEQATRQPVSVEKSAGGPFAKVRGELTEEEFANPAVSRMLLDRIADLEHRLQEENQFRSQFHDADKNRAVLEEKLKIRISSDIGFGVSMSVGSILISAGATFWSAQPYGVISMWSGIALLLGGVISRAVVLWR